MDLRSYIREIQDFPREGILFYDITPLLGDPLAFRGAIDTMTDRVKGLGATKIVAAEARGFIFGAPLAYKLNIGFVPVRKHGKLPHTVCSVSYDLEYGTDTLCMHDDALQPEEPVLIVDDLLATGGTAQSMIKLVEEVGGTVAGIIFLFELGFLKGREKLPEFPDLISIMTENEGS